LLDIFKKAAELKDQEVEGHFRTVATTRPFKHYLLDEELLAFLAKRQIVIYTTLPGPRLILHNKSAREFRRESPSTAWSYSPDPRHGKLPGIRLHFSLYESPDKLGVTFEAGSSDYTGVHADTASSWSMFDTLVKHDDDAPKFIREVVAAGGKVAVSLEELGLAGLVKLDRFFEYEFANQNERLIQLGRAKDFEVFNPCPYADSEHAHDIFYVLEGGQTALLALWWGQLEAYKATLKLSR